MDQSEAVANSRLVAVYDSESDARAAGAALMRAGIDGSQLMVNRDVDRLASVGGEMRQEMDETMLGPGNFGPFTRDMSRGMLLGTVVGGAVGLVLALPFAAFSFGDWPVWARLLVVAIVGIAVGSTVGWLLGGGFGAERASEQLAAEHGTTLAVPASALAQQVLRDTRATRIDVVTEDGRPLMTDHAREEPIARTLGRHVANESERD
jgi:hypothetical protein